MTKLDFEEVREAIRRSSAHSSVYVGCDSIRHRRKDGWIARYSTVVVLHHDSNRGCKIFYDSVDLPDYGNLKQRLLNEVSFAVNAASEIVDVIGKRSLEIHIDVNPNPAHKSNVAVKEALGWVRGSLGLDAQIKPNAWAATHAADHAARHWN